MNSTTHLYRASVVIPTYERRESVRRLLDALENQTMKKDEYEVIVSIDGSEDGTLEMVETYTSSYSLRALWHTNRGRAAACNAGIESARGEYVVLLDDDMEPIPEFLEAHLRAHEGDPHLGVMGAVPIDVASDSPGVVQYIGTKFNQHLENLSAPDHEHNLRDFYSGNFSVRRDVLREAGGFNEAFIAYGNEDLELSHRLIRCGVRLAYSPDAIAHQYYLKDLRALARDSIEEGRTAVLFASMHPEALAGLKLSSYGAASRKWRLVRWVMLTVGQYWPAFPQRVVDGINWRERRRDPRLPLYYMFAVDYFFWLGAQSAVRENQRTGHGLTSLAVPDRKARP